VRELENCVERAVALGDGQLIDLGDLPPAIANASNVQGLPALPLSDGVAANAEAAARPGALSSTDLEDIERATIRRVFEQVNGDKALAGRMLGISRATLYRKLKRYNISGGSAAGASSHTLQ
jgi:DNA-binding NtrC family response regulator